MLLVTQQPNYYMFLFLIGNWKPELSLYNLVAFSGCVFMFHNFYCDMVETAPFKDHIKEFFTQPPIRFDTSDSHDLFDDNIFINIDTHDISTYDIPININEQNICTLKHVPWNLNEETSIISLESDPNIIISLLCTALDNNEHVVTYEYSNDDHYVDGKVSYQDEDCRFQVNIFQSRQDIIIEFKRTHGSPHAFHYLYYSIIEESMFRTLVKDDILPSNNDIMMNETSSIIHTTSPISPISSLSSVRSHDLWY